MQSRVGPTSPSSLTQVSVTPPCLICEEVWKRSNFSQCPPPQSSLAVVQCCSNAVWSWTNFSALVICHWNHSAFCHHPTSTAIQSTVRPTFSHHCQILQHCPSSPWSLVVVQCQQQCSPIYDKLCHASCPQFDLFRLPVVAVNITVKFVPLK